MKSTDVCQVLTARDTKDRLTDKRALVWAADKGELDSAWGPKWCAPGATVLVDTGRQYQTLEGFGGTFVEATASVFQQLSPAKQAEVLSDYFDPKRGHGYTVCRTHINSCDLGNFAYTEVAGDVKLEHFSIARDKQGRIPMMRAAQELAGGPLKIIASPWSPPAWMKTNGEMNHGGKLKPEFRDAWARYYVRFVQEYAKEGVDIWGLTVQNEPESPQTWESCVWTGAEERDFVRDYLGPALERAGLGHVKLIIWDHNRDHMFERGKIVFDDPLAARYVWGTGYHWYTGDNFENVRQLHEAYPDKHLLFTEGSVVNGPHLGEWQVGETYGHSVINDLNCWAVGWIDWSLLLNLEGGPTASNNFASASILVDTEKDALYRQSSFYYLGHFSRYVRPGARRIICASSRDELETTAFLNGDGRIATVVLNRSDKN